MTRYRWYLDPPQTFSSVEDEFPVRGFRLRLLGPTLEVESAADGSEETARRLADEYITLLRGHGVHVLLRTEAQFRSYTSFVVQADPRSPRNHDIVVRAIRAARKSLLSASDPTLTLCYEYRDQMTDDPDRSLFYAYKLIETMGNKIASDQGRSDGEAALIEALGLRKEIKDVKQAASEPRR